MNYAYYVALIWFILLIRGFACRYCSVATYSFLVVAFRIWNVLPGNAWSTFFSRCCSLYSLYIASFTLLIFLILLPFIVKCFWSAIFTIPFAIGVV